MDKNAILAILNDWNFWGNGPETGIKRGSYVERMGQLLSTGQIIAITGPRRAGKSFIIRQFARQLIEDGTPPQNTLIINFEDPRFESLDTDLLQKTYETYLAVHNPSGRPYIFLDEIQEVKNWEKWVMMMEELSKARIIVTGSNAKLLSTELSTLLTGRHVTMKVFPLSFGEVLSFSGIKTGGELDLINRRVEIERLLEGYLEYGAFPKVVLSGGKREILLNYYDDIISKDIIQRFKIRKGEQLKSLARFYASNASSPITFNSAGKFLNISVATIEKFSSYFEEAYLFSFVKRFSPKVKEQEKSPRKVYPVDVGLAKAVGFSLVPNRGPTAEAVVFLELARRQAKNPLAEIYYWKDVQHKEVDFALKNGPNVEELIQVSWDIARPDTKHREISALMKAMNELNLSEGTVITGELEAEEKKEGRTIKFVPLKKWLIEAV